MTTYEQATDALRWRKDVPESEIWPRFREEAYAAEGEWVFRVTEGGTQVGLRAPSDSPMNKEVRFRTLQPVDEKTAARWVVHVAAVCARFPSRGKWRSLGSGPYSEEDEDGVVHAGHEARFKEFFE